MRFSTAGVTAALGLASVVLSHRLDIGTHDDGDNPLYGRSRIQKRDVTNGQKCGAGVGSCADGWCCGPTGVCGQGAQYCGAPDCQLSFGPACDGNKRPPGNDTSKVPRPQFGNVPYGVDIKKCTKTGYVALTFGDGPYIYTTKLLDTLKAAGAIATFFVVAANGGKGEIDDPKTGYPSIIQRMVADGHQVASHTFSHQDMSTITSQQRIDQIIKNEVALTNILGYFPTYIRPPYVSCNADCASTIKSYGYHIADFDVDSNDWKGDYAAAKGNVNAAITSGKPSSNSYIVLNHDIHEKTVNDLVPYLLEQIKKLGYKTATMGECLGDPKENWYRDPLTGGPVGNSTQSQTSSSKQQTNSTSNSTAPTPTAATGDFAAKGSGTPTPDLLQGNGTGNSTKNNAASVPSIGMTAQALLTFVFGLAFFAYTL